MTRVPRPGPAAVRPSGPYDTEAQTRIVTRPVYEAFRADPGRDKMTPANHRLLCEALSAAAVELGAYDHRIVLWLAGWEPSAGAVICGLITRASQPAEREGGKLAAIRGVLDAFDWERDDRQYALERIEQIAAGSRTASGIEPGGSAITPADLRIVLDALDVAADYKRDRVDTCPDCTLAVLALTGQPERCPTCERRLTRADEYDVLAEQLRERL
jgi:hypothetical protein